MHSGSAVAVGSYSHACYVAPAARGALTFSCGPTFVAWVVHPYGRGARPWRPGGGKAPSLTRSCLPCA
eukprot:9561083-Heterocapsa_arctica.AAC.1